MKNTPATYPQSAKTYGRLSTPDPMAEAQSAKILPLMDPFPRLEKVLSLKCLPGLIENLESTILIYGLIDPLAPPFFFTISGSMLASYPVPPLSSSSLLNNSFDEVLKDPLLLLPSV
jgi:hypothetical protein